jgi:hypothetical protein
VSRAILDPRHILRLRLQNQYLQCSAREARALVSHLGVVQSQDFIGALWALALRLDGASLESLRCAFDRGDFLRTHVLRPTWHFVSPADIRWMLALTGTRIRRSMAARERDLGMDAPLVDRNTEAIVRALEGGKALTRAELGVELTRAGVDWHNDGSVLAHLLSTAELAAVVCSGPMQGAQQTYALLEERVPPARVPTREEAVVELVERYFRSHGPATLNDFAWWSGLTVGDARQGLAALGSRFASQTVGELTYWFATDQSLRSVDDDDAMLLLPNFDEFTVAYRSRELFYPREIVYRPGPRYDAPFGNVIVVDGTVHGIWKRSMRKQRLNIEAEWFNPSPAEQAVTFEKAAAKYAAFVGR